jgi:anti-sigma factor RsiW
MEIHMCPDRQILSVYLDGELPSPWKEKLEAHVASCPRCRESLESWKGFAALRQEVDPAVKERVWEAVSLRMGEAQKAAQQAERVLIREDLFREPAFWRRSVTLPFPAAAALGAAAAAAFVLMLTSLWFRAPTPAAPNAAITSAARDEGSSGISGIEMELTGFSSLNDMAGVLQYLGSTDSNDIVIIRLPESRNFQSAGEPKIIRAADYSQRGSSR